MIRLIDEMTSRYPCYLEASILHNSITRGINLQCYLRTQRFWNFTRKDVFRQCSQSDPLLLSSSSSCVSKIYFHLRDDHLEKTRTVKPFLINIGTCIDIYAPAYLSISPYNKLHIVEFFNHFIVVYIHIILIYSSNLSKHIKQVLQKPGDHHLYSFLYSSHTRSRASVEC